MATTSEISIGELAHLIAGIMGVKIVIKEDTKRKRPPKSEVDRLWSDNSKAKKILNWSPEYSLEQGLKKTIDWFKKNQYLYKPNIYNI